MHSFDLTSGLATGCNTVKPIAIKIFDTPEIDSVNVQCSNGSNGKITVFVRAMDFGNPPLTGSDKGLWEYQLLPTGVWQTSPVITGLSSGNYAINIRNSANPNCIVSTSLINVPNAYLYPVNLGGDIVTCLGDPPLTIQLNAGLGYKYYQWQNNSNLSTRSINNYGKYSVIAIDDFGCKSLDTIEIVKLCLASFEIPNAFSPNGDGYNDNFKLFLKNATLKSFSIFNRWGEKVFYTSNIKDGWDGTFKGDQEPVGTYTYLVDYVEDETQNGVIKKGNITLIR
jgi:gliding motility-associated-like protein